MPPQSPQHSDFPPRNFRAVPLIRIPPPVPPRPAPDVNQRLRQLHDNFAAAAALMPAPANNEGDEQNAVNRDNNPPNAPNNPDNQNGENLENQPNGQAGQNDAGNN